MLYPTGTSERKDFATVWPTIWRDVHGRYTRHGRTIPARDLSGMGASCVLAVITRTGNPVFPSNSCGKSLFVVAEVNGFWDLQGRGNAVRHPPHEDSIVTQIPADTCPKITLEVVRSVLSGQSKGAVASRLRLHPSGVTRRLQWATDHHPNLALAITIADQFYRRARRA